MCLGVYEEENNEVHAFHWHKCISALSSSRSLFSSTSFIYTMPRLFFSLFSPPSSPTYTCNLFLCLFLISFHRSPASTPTHPYNELKDRVGDVRILSPHLDALHNHLLEKVVFRCLCTAWMWRSSLMLGFASLFSVISVRSLSSFLTTHRKTIWIQPVEHEAVCDTCAAGASDSPQIPCEADDSTLVWVASRTMRGEMKPNEEGANNKTRLIRYLDIGIISTGADWKLCAQTLCI